MITAGCIVFAVIVLAGGALIAKVHADNLVEMERLAKHQRKLAEKNPNELQEDIFFVRHSGYFARLLEQAGLEAKYKSVKIQWICSAAAASVALTSLAMVLAPDLIVVALILGILIGAGSFLWYLQFLTNQRQKKLTQQLPLVLESMASSLKAGSPIIEIFKMLSDTAPEPIRSEFKRALVSLQLGKSFRDTLKEMSYRIRAEDFKLLIQAIIISQEVGANLSGVVETIAQAIRERFKLKNYLDSLTSQGKLAAMIIGALPYIVTLAVYLLIPDYMGVFLKNPGARLITLLLVIWEGIGFWILMKLTTFEV